MHPVDGLLHGRPYGVCLLDITPLGAPFPFILLLSNTHWIKHTQKYGWPALHSNLSSPCSLCVLCSLCVTTLWNERGSVYNGTKSANNTTCRSRRFPYNVPLDLTLLGKFSPPLLLSEFCDHLRQDATSYPEFFGSKGAFFEFFRKIRKKFRKNSILR